MKGRQTTIYEHEAVRLADMARDKAHEIRTSSLKLAASTDEVYAGLRKADWWSDRAEKLKAIAAELREVNSDEAGGD